MNYFSLLIQWLFHSSEEFCELNLTYFKIFGLFQMINPYNRVSITSQRFWYFFHASIILFTSVHTLFQVISLLVEGANYQRISNKITHIGNWTVAALKFVNLACSRRRLGYLFDIFKIDFLKVTAEKGKKEILYEYAHVCNWFILLYVLSCLFTCCVWNAYPIAELIYYSIVQRGNTTYQPRNILDSWYPFDSTTTPIFYYIYFYEFIIYFYMLFAFCCYDSYLFSIFTMMTGQFGVLYKSFSDIGYDKPIKKYDPYLDDLYLLRLEETLQYVRDKFVSTTSDCPLNNLVLSKSKLLLEISRIRVIPVKGEEENHKAQDFLDRFIECTLDLQKANRHANELIGVYNNIIVFQIVVSVITICLMAFQTIVYFVTADDEFTGTLQISKSLTYFGCAFLLLLLSCKCSGDLNDARRDINLAFYEAHWHEFKLPKHVTRNLLLSMTCGQRIQVVEITHRFPIDLQTFSEIIQVCFSYFTFLLNYYRKKSGY